MVVVETGTGQEDNVPDKAQAPNLSAIKDHQQKTWTSGNYAKVGNTLVIMGELLCEAVNVHAGDKASTSLRVAQHRHLRYPQVLRRNQHILCTGTDRTRPQAR